MRWYLSHAAMLLLGVTLTVGFYEGRRLVKNTARALGAGGSVAGASARREETEELRDRLAEAEEKLAGRRATRSEDRQRRRSARAEGEGPPLDRAVMGGQADPSTMSRADRLQMMRDRRLRMSGEQRPPLAIRPLPNGVLPPGGTLPAGGTLPPPPPIGGQDAELVDTGAPTP